MQGRSGLPIVNSFGQCTLPVSILDESVGVNGSPFFDRSEVCKSIQCPESILHRILIAFEPWQVSHWLQTTQQLLCVGHSFRAFEMRCLSSEIVPPVDALL